MKAAIISQGSVSSKWTLEAMREYFDEVDDINVKNLEISIGDKAQILHKGEPLKKYDCIYAKGSFRYSQILRSLTSILHKECYMPIIPSAFTIAHDKLLTQLMMQQHSVPMPKTYISSTILSARQLLSSLNYPIIMKFPQGTQGKGVMFADSFSSASSILDALSALKQSFIIQEYVDTGATDLRAFVIGDKVVAGMMRRGAKDEVRSNIHTGGVGEAFEIDEMTKQIAVKAAKAIGAEICGVDILQGIKGPLVIEANISPGLQGITKATKVDVAKQIAKYLFEQTQLRKGINVVQAKKEVMADININKENNIITNLDFRGSRILLPEMISMMSKIKSDDQVEISVKKNEINLKKII